MAGFFSSGRGFYSESPAEKSKRRSLRKAQKVLRSSREPMIPFFCRIFFIMMIAAPALDTLLEIVMQIRAERKLPAGELFYRISWSDLLLWGGCAVILIILSDIQLIRNRRYGYEERIYRFEEELKAGESLSDFDMKEVPNSEMDKKALTLYSKVIPGGTRAKYLRYVLIAGVGTAVFAVLYFIAGAVR